MVVEKEKDEKLLSHRSKEGTFHLREMSTTSKVNKQYS